MSALRLLLDLLLTAAAGAAAAGLAGDWLSFEERVAMTPVLGIVGGSALTLLLALPLGLSAGTVLGGPALLAVIATGASLRRGSPLGSWGNSWREARPRWRDRPPWALLGVAAAAILAFAVLLGRGVFERDGGIWSGYGTVWADWAHHHTRAASFAVAHNLPPQDPLFGGTPLRYPFLPDLHSAGLEVLGAGPGLAYALPGVVLCTSITLLLCLLAQRLRLRLAVGAVAALLCFVGGGLGFVGLFGDACAHHGFAADRCSPAHLLRSPGDGLVVVAGTVHDLPGTIAAQPRAYDGIDHQDQPLPNLQWYTPLIAWWLPQTSLAYGMAVVLTVLLLVAVPAAGQRGPLSFAIAGGLIGLLPLIHMHALIALALVLPLVALGDRRREWLLLAGVAAVVALPRLVQVALGPHGTAASGNQFPWLEPGWMWDDSPQRPRVEASAGGALGALISFLRLPLTPRFWSFWVANLGVAVPLCLLVVVAWARRSATTQLGRISRWLLRPLPEPAVRLCLPLMVIFPVANLVVFQSWDWDNTKLLVYWYVGAALLAGAVVVHLICGSGGPAEAEGAPGETASRPRRRSGRLWLGAAGAGLLGTLVSSGGLTLLRLLPWTPPVYASGAPFQAASPEERELAAAVVARTPERALFLTPGRPQDPVLTLAGRQALMGYYGWVWSYGTDVGARPEAIHTLYRGCATVAQEACPVWGLLHAYGISFVEIDDRLQDGGVVEPATDLGWWAAQGLPVVARGGHIVVYDVRQR